MGGIFLKCNTPISGSSSKTRPKPFKECPLCKQTHKARFDHHLSECQFLPERDKKFWARARLTTDYDVEGDTDNDIDQFSQLMLTHDDNPSEGFSICEIRRVQIKDSPHLNMYIDNTLLT